MVALWTDGEGNSEAITLDVFVNTWYTPLLYSPHPTPHVWYVTPPRALQSESQPVIHEALYKAVSSLPPREKGVWGWVL